MVKLVNHLCFIQRHRVCQFTSPTCVMKQPAICRHVEHGHEFNTPRITVRFILIPKYWYTLVNAVRYFCIFLASKYWTSSSVGVQACNVFSCQCKAATRVFKLLRIAQEERKPSCLCRTYRQKAKLETAMYSSKQAFPIFKIHQLNNSTFTDLAKECTGGVISCNSTG